MMIGGFGRTFKCSDVDYKNYAGTKRVETGKILSMKNCGTIRSTNYRKFATYKYVKRNFNSIKLSNQPIFVPSHQEYLTKIQSKKGIIHAAPGIFDKNTVQERYYTRGTRNI